MYVPVLWYVHYIRARSREPLQVAPEHRAPQNQNRTFYNTRGKMDLGEGKKKKKKGGGSDERTCRHRCRRKKRQQYQAGVICTRCQTTRLRRRQLPRGSIVKSHHLPEVNANMFTYCQVPRPDMGRFTSLPWTSIPIFIVGMVAEPNPRTVVSRMDNILGERVLMNVFCVIRRSTLLIFQTEPNY